MGQQSKLNVTSAVPCKWGDWNNGFTCDEDTMFELEPGAEAIQLDVAKTECWQWCKLFNSLCCVITWDTMTDGVMDEAVCWRGDIPKHVPEGPVDIANNTVTKWCVPPAR